MIMNNELDKKIKETLENLEAPRSMNWGRMEQRLQAEEEKLKNEAENNFDNNIKEKIAQPTAIFNAPQSMNWDRMEQRLQAEEEKLKNEAENNFDNNIKEKIAQPTAKFNANHWRLLSRRLDLQAEWRTALYRYKAIEATLMLILLVTMLNFFTSNIQNQTANLSDNNTTKVDSKINNQVNNQAYNQVRNKNSYKNALSSVVAYPKDMYHNTANTKRSQVATIIHNKDEKVMDFVKNDVENNVPILVSMAQNTMQVPMSEEVVTRENVVVLAAMPTAEFKDLTYKTDNKFQKTLPTLNVPKTWFWIASLETTLNSNRILEAAQYSNNDHYIIKKTTNQGFMARLGVAKGSNRIMTGLGFDQMLFNSISYRPIANGEKRVINNKVDLRTAHIPLSFEHSFGNGRLEPFIHLGATAHLVIKGKYDYRNQSLGRTVSVPPYATLAENPLPDGLYYNSDLIGNAYMSFDLGFGAIYKLTKHVSISSQIEYHQNLSKYGLGPNNNKIDQLQLATGFRFKY